MNCLTNQEIEITRLIAAGLRNIEIAKSLNISVSTVKTHLEHIFEKTNSKSRVEVAVKYVKHTLAE